SPVKLHVGTKEADGRIVLLDKKILEPGDECYVQFRLDEPVVVAAGDPYIVRLQTPTYTIGGGRILDASDQKLRPFKDENLMRLVEKEASISNRFSALEFALKEMGRRPVDLKEFSVAAKAPADQVEAAVKQFEAAGKIVRFDAGRFMHADAVEATMQFLKAHVETFHQRNPLRAGIDLLVLRTDSKIEEALFRRSLDELVRRGVFAVENAKARLAGFSMKLSREDGEAAAEVERVLKAGKFATPRIDELYGLFKKYNRERIDRVLGMLVDQGMVVRLKDDVLFHRDTVEEAKKLIAEAIRARGAIEAATVRDLTGTSRKFVIPLLEHLDDVGFTQRVENRRILKAK
ncbi:MAG TPA: SelB C-terminal domain-containing protein, partial [Planctomycetota bacterium]|nr:SelB C-terminal domain-containing protein [Planctomycetota bacterium]